MKQKYYETKEFQENQRYWYEVLRANGFNHIESILDIANYNFNKQVITVDFEQVRHFEKCSLHLNSGEMKDKFNIFILDLYRDGLSTIQIEKEFAKAFKFKPLTQKAIHDRLMKILKIIGIPPIKFNF